MSVWEAALRGTARGLAELLPVSSRWRLSPARAATALPVLALPIAIAALHSAGVW